jgi:hypothetical protein
MPVASSHRFLFYRFFLTQLNGERSTVPKPSPVALPQREGALEPRVYRDGFDIYWTLNDRGYRFLVTTGVVNNWRSERRALLQNVTAWTRTNGFTVGMHH